MRALALLCCFAAAPLSAETILATSTITAVTVYPQGAQVTRLVKFEAASGGHDLLVIDLPQETDPISLRLVPAEGLFVGASALRTGRVAPQDLPDSPEVAAARDALERAEDAATAAQMALEAGAARIEAAQAQIAYLSRLGGTDAKQDTEVLQATARMIGAEVLAAANAALTARADLPSVRRVLISAQESQARAAATLAALTQAPQDRAALSLAVTANTAGAQQVEISQFVGNAGWSPVYDMALDRTAGQVVLDRALLVSQATGEDWTDVTLTVSTAQPGNRTSPTDLWPPLHRIADPAGADVAAVSRLDRADAVMDAPTMEAAPDDKLGVQFQGDIVSYSYSLPVDIADGVENLRLALDQIILPATVQAHAVPSRDASAFAMADLTNNSGQILLPGPAYLSRDGAFVGQTYLAALAPGAGAVVGFGAVDGLRLKRIMPARAEGDRGIFNKSNRSAETAVLTVENLTAEAWDIRVLEAIPYSEQEDLMITHTADPEVSVTDVDGKRGLLAWDGMLEAGQSRDIRLTIVESWPDGKDLVGGRF
jgi:uncharacterized protein (TIGR02231 family)